MSDSSFATISTGGLATALNKAGTITVTATAGGVTSPTVTLTITPGPISKLVVVGSQTVISGSNTSAFTASGADQFGNAVALSQAVGWSAGANGDVGTGTIDQTTGVFLGQKDGVVTVTATSGALSQTATITVTGSSALNTLSI